MQAPTTSNGPTSSEPSGRTCPHCGATNGLTAAFCWQCFQPFGGRAAPPGLAGSPRTGGPPADAAAQGAATGWAGPPAPPWEARTGRWTPTPAPFPTSRPIRHGGTITSVVVVALAAIAGVVWFLGRPGEVRVPESFGGLTRLENAQTKTVVDAFRAEVDSAGLEGEMAMYGDEIPTAALIWVRDASVPTTDAAFEQFATGFDAGIGSQGSLDSSQKTSDTVEGVTYVCAPVVSVAPGSICMWQDEDVFWLLFELSVTGSAQGQGLAVVAHDAVEAD